MDQNVLLTGLIVLVLILAFMLISRTIRERRQMAAVKRLKVEAFSDLLKSNSVEGTIVGVAKRVSDLLIESFGCDHIIFLRKKRGLLELNYYHGIRGFNRGDFRFSYNAQLGELLRNDFVPRPTAELCDLVPEKFYRKIQQYKLDLFFPIYWRDNLYGIYLIRSTIKTDSPAFGLLAASLAQILSAAYHIKWHESRQDTLQRQVDEISDRLKQMRDRDRSLVDMVRLVRHRDSRTIVSQVMGKVREASGISEMVYLYEPGTETEQPQLLTNGLSRPVTVPDRKVFEDIIKAVESRRRPKSGELAADSDLAADWIRELQQTGLKNTSSFPLTSSRRGVLAWTSELPAETVEKNLNTLRTHAADLVENAESFERVEEMSYTDNLTGLANRRYFFRRLEEEVSRARRYNRQVALIIFDLDGLKQTNDTYGHLAGDAVLKQMGAILRRSIRTIDVVARYGGDEFCVIMPEADEATCSIFMHRLQSEISRSHFRVEGVENALSTTVSLGGAIFPDHGEDPRQLVFAADMALLRAKETGRNRSLIYSADI